MVKGREYRERKRKAAETLRFLKQAGEVPEDYTLVDFLDELNITETADDKVIEAEAVLLFFNFKGEGFIEQVCPECGQRFAYKYRLVSRDSLNPPKINDRMKPSEIKAIKEQIEDIQEDLAEFQRTQGMRCSNACRALGLKRIGIEWNPHKKPENRWLSIGTGGELPLTVPPPAYRIMEEEHDIVAEYTN